MRQREKTAEGKMALLIISIPFMVLGFGIAVVPLIAAMRRPHELQDESDSRRSSRRGHVVDPYAHVASLNEYLVDHERELVDAA